MARLRTLKPAFFVNEELATIRPLGRLLFQGLWCLADRRGRLEDRPLRIKAEVLPYDHCNVDSLLSDLAEHGFIQRYEMAGERYIQVVKFEKHQTPHIKEADSTIPAPDEHGASTGKDVASTPRVSGIGNLEPDYGNLEPGGVGGAAVATADVPEPGSPIAEIYHHYRERIQPQSRICPTDKIKRRLKRFTAHELLQGIDHFADDWWWMGHNRTRGAPWFFESDARSEQFLNLEPRPEERTNGTHRNDDRHSGPDIDALTQLTSRA